jgi:hypothetical protein
MKLILLPFLLFVSYFTNGQNAPIKFGDIPMADMKMTVYDKDSSATAVILFDLGDCQLSDDLNVEYKRHVRIKFFTKASIDEWATKTLLLTHNEDGLSKLKAATYNLENGKIELSEMEEASIFKTKVNRYTDQIKFTLPKVKEGTVIEYSYVLKTKASLLPSWQFQHSIPVIRSEYKASIPKNFTFRKDLQGFLSPQEHSSKYDGALEQWAMNNVPAFKEEPFMTTPEDYVSKINFYLSEVFIPGRPLMNFNRSWRSIIKDLDHDADFGIQIRTSGFLKKIVEEITAGITDENKKMKAIYDYVKSNVAWNKLIDKIPDHPFKKVLDEKKGSSSEINLLLVSMLQKSGLNASPVLISTRQHGMIRPFVPMFSQFNDVICLVKIGDKNILMDGTDKDLSMSALPERCLNGEGLVVSMDEMEWVPLVSMRSRIVVNVDYKVDDAGELIGKMNITRDGLEGSSMRKSFTELGEEKYIKELLSQKSWGVSNSKFDNIADANSSSKESHDVTISDHTQVAGSVIYLNPYLIGKMEENKFKSEERKYPVDFSTPFDKIYMAKIQIPDGFVVEELPKPQILKLPENGGRFVYNATPLGNTINFVSQFIINKSVFMVEEYPSLREFYSLVVAKQAEQIVIKKK